MDILMLVIGITFATTLGYASVAGYRIVREDNAKRLLNLEEELKFIEG